MPWQLDEIICAINQAYADLASICFGSCSLAGGNACDGVGLDGCFGCLALISFAWLIIDHTILDELAQSCMALGELGIVVEGQPALA